MAKKVDGFSSIFVSVIVTFSNNVKVVYNIRALTSSIW